jgi:effector-binding domain-containing protein
MLRLRREQIRQELEQTHSQLLEVELRLQQIEREDSLSTHDVILKHVEPQLVASVRTIVPRHNDISPLYGEVYEALGNCADQCGQSLAIWYDDDYQDQNVDGEAAFTVRSRVPERGRMHVHELPAATMAATVHQGSYNTLIDAHEAILKWIEANGYHLTGPSREVYLYNTMPIDHDDPSYITEVQFPVKKALSE